ncbi:hypothetical protein N7539_007085 [Penicillium diatomitis]|uniref:DUF6604 domain-containing protein n=1 Tax=Penicillium diatomitis TaxID=2819901 RepID=A0A9W9WVA4_9EURO|nr:uncharacterized protein N7539_007085 [Penicillium diatomitis]KAJ5476941.1 hypothetical protein N7539_007085 [Penicillium diatomitis]
MLPDFLQSSYARYKADTSTFATWLLETAHQCGYQPPFLADALPQASKGKGRSRKKGNQRAKQGGKKTNKVKPSIGDSDANPIQYSATTKDLQKLAEVIAGSSLAVPRSILTIAKRAIKLRKTVTSWFLGRGNSAYTNQHAHFITVLEQICEVLEWKTSKTSKQDAKQPPPPKSEEELDDANSDSFLNRFAVLTVEEPQETTETQATPVETKKIVKVNDVEEDEDEEADSLLGQLLFKSLCLLQDLSNIRKFISITWAEYRDQKIDLMNAAIVTDSALKLARDLSREVEADWRATLPKRREGFQDIIYKIAVFNRGISGGPSAEIGLPYNKHIANEAEWCYIPTKILLDSFTDVLEDGYLPVFKKGHFGHYDPQADRERMSLRQKFNEDKILLCSILPDFCMMEPLKIHLPTEDAITQGLTEYARTKRVTLWLSFTSQSFLDIHHIIRHTPSGAFRDLQISRIRINETIEDYFQLAKTHPSPKF